MKILQNIEKGEFVLIEVGTSITDIVLHHKVKDSNELFNISYDFGSNIAKIVAILFGLQTDTV